MKAAELRSKQVSALQEQLHDLVKEQFNLRMQTATGQLGTTHKIRQIRKDIARVKTVINEMQKGAQ